MNAEKSVGPVAVAFVVGVAVGALAGAAGGFWINAENLRESDALLKRARALLQRAEDAARESETAPRPAADLPEE